MVDRRWSAEETAVLINAWRGLYHRRRGGQCDVWVPKNQRSRARSTGALVSEDWRAVATDVNRFRTVINLDPSRTKTQCQKRVKRLLSRFGEEQLATPSWYDFLPVACKNTARDLGHSMLRVLATAAMEADGGGAAGGGSAVAQGGSSAAEVPVGAATENASDGVPEVEVENGGTATAPEPALGCGASSEDNPTSGPVDGLTAAATPFLGGPIRKKRRTGASSSAGAGDGPVPSVKEELVREMNARRARTDAPLTPGGGSAAATAEMTAALGELVAAGSNDVAVVAKLTETLKETTTLYRVLTTQRIELQTQIVAALVAATTGGAAVPEPDAAPFRLPVPPLMDCQFYKINMISEFFSQSQAGEADFFSSKPLLHVRNLRYPMGHMEQ